MTVIKSLIIANHNYYYYSTVKMDEVNQDVESFPMLIVKFFFKVDICKMCVCVRKLVIQNAKQATSL